MTNSGTENSPDLGITAIVPMKPLAEGKSRLARALSAEERANISLGMLFRVISALKGASIDSIWIVGGDQRVRGLADSLGAVWVEELGTDLNDTLAQGIQLVFDSGQSAMYVAGDLPFVKASDVYSLIQASRGKGNVALAPARRDGGTNAMLVPHGIPLRPELGRLSFSKHLAQAARLETSVAIAYSPGLGLDLDLVDDLESYQHMEPGLVEHLMMGAEGPLGSSGGESGGDSPSF